ncbi:hypothetical protein B0H16DRAFT_1830749, partial [Mycena metata]
PDWLVPNQKRNTESRTGILFLQNVKLSTSLCYQAACAGVSDSEVLMIDLVSLGQWTHWLVLLDLPPELVEQIIDDAWGCLSTSNHRHGYFVTQWMLVSGDWLKIVLFVVFRGRCWEIPAYDWWPKEHPLTELHISFAYTSPHPIALLDAPRGTFFPRRWSGDLPTGCCFRGVRKLVVRDANADFVAFMTIACPQLERIESTAEFRAEDVPPHVPKYVRDRLQLVRLPRTATYPGLTANDTMLYPSLEYSPTTRDELGTLSESDCPFLPFPRSQEEVSSPSKRRNADLITCQYSPL